MTVQGDCTGLFVVQGDSGVEVNTLGGNSIGHCEGKISWYEQVFNSE
jgi:hypothetical protein